MVVPGIFGSNAILLVFVMVLVAWIHHKWRNVVARKEEIRRLVDMVSEESARAEFETTYEYNALPRANQCAICFCPTTTRCSRCKSVHYCSGKCQIIHWRQGHKDKCRLLTLAMGDGAVSEKQSKKHGAAVEPLVNVSSSQKLGCSGFGRLVSSSRDNVTSMTSNRANYKEMQETKMSPPVPTKLVNDVDGVNVVSGKSRINDRGADSKFQCPSNAKQAIHEDVRSSQLGNKKSVKRATSSEMPVTNDSKDWSLPSSSCSRLNSVTGNGGDDSPLFNGNEVRSSSFNASGGNSQDAFNGTKKSMWRKVQQLKASKQNRTYKISFSYELFAKLYTSKEELNPFGLINCGNSCYANSVLQCLAFTRPFTSYLIRGLHSCSCQKKGWCFTCEFECLIRKAREGESPLSPIGILSKIQKIGSHLGHGTEEDAHEFLRYAVDTMQFVCLEEAGSLGPLAEETTLVGLTFGGYLRSKITCMRCLSKSERFERIMDLSVEIDGDIRTLEEALAQFTADEMLDGNNKYHCTRCKAYVKAKKKLKISGAPNILTIVLKRFRSGSLEKLNKSVRFPKSLNITPYMCGSDESPQYSLYAVIVHRDHMNATSTGHYVCYVKNFHGEWFGINDSMVLHVQLERVLSEEAYMLLYARHSPRPLSLLSNNVVSNGGKSKKKNLEAIPSRNSTSRTRNSNIPSSEPCEVQQKHGKHFDRMNPDHAVSYELHNSDYWRFQAMQRISQVDSSSESSSFFSSSDASSCSSASTKDSVKSDDLTDFIFGDVGRPGWYSYVASDSVEPSLCRNMDTNSNRVKDTWRQSYPGNDCRWNRS